jgi:hypothetical protein
VPYKAHLSSLNKILYTVTCLFINSQHQPAKPVIEEITHLESHSPHSSPSNDNISMPRLGADVWVEGERHGIDGWVEPQADGSLKWMGPVPSSRAQAEYLGDDYVRLTNPAEPRLRIIDVHGRREWVPIRNEVEQARGPPNGPDGAHAGHEEANEPEYHNQNPFPDGSDPAENAAFMRAVTIRHEEWKRKHTGPVLPWQRGRANPAEVAAFLRRPANLERQQAMNIDPVNATMLELVARLRVHEEDHEEWERLQGIYRNGVPGRAQRGRRRRHW